MASHVDHWLALARHTPLALLLDLDGTLIPFASTPGEARPSPELLTFLAKVAAAPGVTCAVVSGRPRSSLEEMFASVPELRLVAEHGAWRKGSGAWHPAAQVEVSALDELEQLFAPLLAAHAGSFVERKSASVCAHYRCVPAAEREAFLVGATALVERWLESHPSFDILDVVEAIEVRARHVNKGISLEWVRERAGVGVRCIALGDDVTDEDMFAVLGPGDDAILVGPGRRRSTLARWRLSDPPAVSDFLRWILAARQEGSGPDHALPVAMATYSRPRAGTSSERPRLLAISNRLPHLRERAEPSDKRNRNVGGLVSALEPVLAERHGLWLGWSGKSTPTAQASAVRTDAETSPSLAWIDLPEAWQGKYYNGLCNRGLWPLFHSFPGRVRFADDEWEAYVQANEAFAAAAGELVDPDAAIWAHDYHVLLVATALRRRGHRGPLGLFLHIPFPGADLFEMLPWAGQILDGLLDFDLVGFHTPGFAANFRECVSRFTPGQVGDDVVLHRGRRTRVQVFPIGIMPEGFQEPAEPATAADVAALVSSLGATRLVLGVDRLDYTKGIPERLLAFERLLRLFPEWRGKVSLVQVSVPSRADVPEYAEQRQIIETAVGRINGEYGESHWVPVRYLYRSYTRNHLALLYRTADVGYVTPLRDGMNLVAKEFVAAQDPTNPGVLLLSRFAGAAVELHEALLTNPYHADGMARDLDRALRMPAPERRGRHSALLETVSRTTALTWATDFVTALESVR